MREANIKADDPLSLVREIVRDALWSIAYHESELPKSRSKLVLAKELIKRCGVDYNDVPEPKEDEDGEPILTSPDQLACSTFDEATRSVAYHEGRLQFAHVRMAFASIMLSRGNYTEIDIAEIQKGVDEELKKGRTG